MRIVGKILRIVGLVLVLTIAPLSLAAGSARAAGSLTVTANPLSGWQAGGSYPIMLYGTTAGANTAGFSFVVTLTNATISSYDPSGNPFDSDGVVAGGSAGSTSATINVGTANLAGLSGQLFIGKLNIVANSTPGTATVSINNVEAYDADLSTMTGNGSTQNVTIASTTTPTPTPEDQSSESSPIVSNTPAPPNQSTTRSLSSNSDSKVTVPDESGEPVVMTEEQQNEVIKRDAPKPDALPSAGKGDDPFPIWRVVGYSAIGIGLVGALYLLVASRRVRGKTGVPAATAPKPITPKAVTPPLPKKGDELLAHAPLEVKQPQPGEVTMPNSNVPPGSDTKPPTTPQA